MNKNRYKFYLKLLSIIVFFENVPVSAQDNNLIKRAIFDGADIRKAEVGADESSSLKAEEVKVYESTEYYSVSAKTKKELVGALVKSSPIVTGGDGFLGQTQLNFKWSIDWLKDNNSCWVKNANVALYVTFRLPKLESASKEVDEVWLGWYPKLLAHEYHHRDIDLAIAKKIFISLNNLSPEVNCEVLLQNAAKIVNEYDKESSVQQDKYDLETNHGETEGLILHF